MNTSYIDDILAAGNHLHALVTDILDFARLEAGKLKLHIAPLDLRKLIGEVVMMLAGPVKAKKLELLVNYADTAPQQYSIQQPLLLLVVTDQFLPTQNAVKKAGFNGYITKPTHPTELLIDLAVAWEAWQEQRSRL